MDMAITKMSSKGQIVIPREMRTGIAEGDKLIVIRQDDDIILKKVSKLGKNFEKELKRKKRIEEAWKRYDEGKFTSSTVEEFIEEMKKW